MLKMYRLAFVFAAMLLLGHQVIADVGVTDDCQEDIQTLEDEIERDKDDYTAESRRKAQTQLAAAKTNRLNPAKCRKNLSDARRELRQGKREQRREG